MDSIWIELYNKAMSKIKVQSISHFIDIGNISCAILASDNKIYTGTEILSNTSINTSAEKNAILNMLNNGVSEIKKIVIINELGETIQPHEDSFEYFSLLNSLENVEVLINLEEEKVIKLTELFPSWWVTFRVKEK